MKLHSLRYLIREGLKNILSNRMMSLASVVVLVSCLIITGSAALISVNVNALIANIGDDNQLTVYLKPDFPDADSVKLKAKLSAIENITNCRYRTKDDVLKDYQETLGKDLYETMQGSGNPFGNEYRVTLKDLSLYDQTVKQIETLDGIDKISDRSDIAGKLTRLNYFVTVAGLWFVVILATVRDRHHEIGRRNQRLYPHPVPDRSNGTGTDLRTGFFGCGDTAVRACEKRCLGRDTPDRKSDAPDRTDLVSDTACNVSIRTADRSGRRIHFCFTLSEQGRRGYLWHISANTDCFALCRC